VGARVARLMFEYDAVVRAVHDGDTVTVDWDLGRRVWVHGEHLRLIGLNAPELNTPAGKDAQAWLAAQLPTRTCESCHQNVGVPVTIRTERDRQEKYGRYLATLLLPDGRDLNAALLASGHARAWDGHGERPV
jgi:micrococcal nuclease